MLRARSSHQVWEREKWRGKKRKTVQGKTRPEMKEWDVGNQQGKFEPWPESIKLLSSGNSISTDRFNFNKV